MNESSWQKVSAALILTLGLSGCLRSEPLAPLPPSPTAFAELAKDIAEFRGLPLKRDIVLNGFARGPEPANYYLAYSTEQIERAYRHIGLLPADSELRRALADLRRFEPRTADDPAKTAVAVAPAMARLGAPFEKTHPTLNRELPLVLAVVEALQEQNFQWQGKINSIVLEDRRLALRAMAIGDAVLTAIARANRKTKGNLTAADLEMAGRIAIEIDKLAVNLPVFLRHALSFSYRDGSQFVLWALRAKGWPGVNALFARPPLSSAQILHPEKYFLQPEPPQRFFPAALLRRMGGSAPVEQSLGECLIRALLTGALPSRNADDIAAGWRGDTLFSFPANDDLLTGWYSSWRSDRDAANFHRAYRGVLEKQRQVRFDSAAGMTNGALFGTGRDGRGAWLQVNGPVVLLLTGAPAPRVKELTDEAWKDLEIDTDTTTMRLDFAGKNYPSLSSK